MPVPSKVLPDEVRNSSFGSQTDMPLGSLRAMTSEKTPCVGCPAGSVHEGLGEGLPRAESRAAGQYGDRPGVAGPLDGRDIHGLRAGVPGRVGWLIAGPLGVSEVRGVGEALGYADSQGIGAAAIDPQVDDQALEALGALSAEDRVQHSVEFGQMGGVGSAVARISAEAGDPQVALSPREVGVSDPPAGEILEVAGVLEVTRHNEPLDLGVQLLGGHDGAGTYLREEAVAVLDRHVGIVERLHHFAEDGIELFPRRPRMYLGPVLVAYGAPVDALRGKEGVVLLEGLPEDVKGSERTLGSRTRAGVG